MDTPAPPPAPPTVAASLHLLHEETRQTAYLLGGALGGFGLFAVLLLLLTASLGG